MVTAKSPSVAGDILCTVWLSDPLETYKNLEQMLIEEHFKGVNIDIVKLDAEEVEKKLADGIFPDIFILDILQPFVDGKNIINLIRKKNPTTKIILVSGNDLSELTNLNIPIIVKPFVASTFIGTFNTIYSAYILGSS